MCVYSVPVDPQTTAPAVEAARARIVAEIERLNVVLLHGTWSERMERRCEELVRQWHDAGRRWRVDYEEVE